VADKVSKNPDTSEPRNGSQRRSQPFNPKKHLMKVRGGQDYLEVKWRLVWFREDHPDWGIETKPIMIDAEKGLAIFQAQVFDSEGRLRASGTKMESVQHFGDYLEKSETGAIGRALAVCGYGTQFAPELEEGDRIVDAPVSPSIGQRVYDSHASRVPCRGTDCSMELTRAQAEYSQKTYGRPLCPICQKKQNKQPAPAGDPA
jgi:hypothetical protein